MRNCKTCSAEINQGELYECPVCGAVVCKACRNKTQNICPYCYGDLTLKG